MISYTTASSKVKVIDWYKIDQLKTNLIQTKIEELDMTGLNFKLKKYIPFILLYFTQNINFSNGTSNESSQVKSNENRIN